LAHIFFGVIQKGVELFNCTRGHFTKQLRPPA
jgi:hypothetical protein